MNARGKDPTNIKCGVGHVSGLTENKVWSMNSDRPLQRCRGHLDINAPFSKGYDAPE